MIKMSTKVQIALGAAGGYVLGARAGRERYDQIAHAFGAFVGDPRVRRTTSNAASAAVGLAGDAVTKVKDTVSGEPEEVPLVNGAYPRP